MLNANADAALEAARAAQHNAYAPYSKFRVGCVLEAANGQLYRGCNVENASFGLTLCAERVALGCAVAAGQRAFRKLVLVTDSPQPVAPCGACRQMLVEFSPSLEIISYSRDGAMRSWALDALLADRFELPPASPEEPHR
jgi:cytidine deaminase